MVEDDYFGTHSRPGVHLYHFEEDDIPIEDLDDDGMEEHWAKIFELILNKDNEEILRKLVPKPIGIGSPTNHEEFQKGVDFAKELYDVFLSQFIDQKVEDGFASSLGLLTEHEKRISYHEKHLESLLNLSEQEPTEEAPNGPVAAYDLLVQILEDSSREGKLFPQILRPFAADVFADTRRDKAEKKHPRPKHPNEKPGKKKIFHIWDKGLDIVVLALVREGWLEVGNESNIPDEKEERNKLENPEQRYEDDAWANSAIFGVAIATGMSFSAVKKATAKYRRQRGSKYQ